MNLLSPVIADLEEAWFTERGLSYIDRYGRQLRLNDERTDPNFVTKLIIDFAGRSRIRLDPKVPYGGGRIQLGEIHFRWHAIIPPLSQSGPTLTLRAQRPIDSSSKGCGLRQILQDIHALMNRSSLPIYIVGPTGSGKTHLLRAVMREYLRMSRLVIIESTDELNAEEIYWIKLMSKCAGIDGRGGISEEVIAKEALRLRPDFIVFGELRGLELARYWGLIDSGHRVIGTIHGCGLESLTHKLAFSHQKAGHTSANNLFHAVVVRRQSSEFHYDLHENARFIL